MALVNVQLSWAGDEASTEQGQGVGALVEAAALKYTVLYDGADATEGAYDAVYAVGVPGVGDAHPDSAYLQLLRKRAIPVGPLLYEVFCEYAGKDSPLLDPYELRWETAYSVEPVDTDADGDPLVNTAGDPVSGLTCEFADEVMCITRNEAAYSMATRLAYRNTINDATWYGVDAGVARMVDISTVRVVTGATYYYPTTYKIQFRVDGWKHRYPSKGLYYRSGTRWLPIRDDDDGPVTKDKFLDAAGAVLAHGAAHYYIEKPKYTTSTFATLGLV